ncbi:MAG: class II aldolase/adducin family protein [Bryobacteraceae bacterium]|nr:class II aldolase/adducin family protein [Bryobacteraceae bacterium]
MTAAEELATAARSLFARGYSFGTAGNLSVRDGDVIYVSPTNSSFEDLTAAGLSVVDGSGKRLSGPPPSKEVHFHLALYEARPDAVAVVHLHSTYATAVSCLPAAELPIFTPYFAMRIPCLPVVPYFAPGAAELGPAVREAARLSPAMLLKNHGPITAGKTIREATALAEELEEQSKLYFLLGERGERLTAEQVAYLRAKR